MDVKKFPVLLLGALVFVVALEFCSAMPGGWSTASVNNENVQTFAKWAVEEYGKGKINGYTCQLMRVYNASTQVVAGTNYRFTVEIGFEQCIQRPAQKATCNVQQTQMCIFVVWSRPWTSSLSLTSSQCQPIIQITTPSTTTEATAVFPPGGYSPKSVNDSQVQSCAKFAVSAFSKQTNSACTIGLLQVTKAEIQVVAGMNYQLTVVLGYTNCPGIDQPSNAVQQTQQCTFVVFVALNSSESLSSTTCGSMVQMSLPSTQSTTTAAAAAAAATTTTIAAKAPPTPRGLVGGFQTQDVNDSDVQSVSQWAVKTYDDNNNSTCTGELLQVIKAATQVVEGINYLVTVVIGYPNCQPNGVQGNTVEQTRQCTFEVWDVPWESSMTLTSTDCQSMIQMSSAPASTSTATTLATPLELPGVDQPKEPAVEQPGGSVGGIPGGYVQVSVNDSNVQRYAAWAVEEYSNQTNTNTNPTTCTNVLLQVETAATQVVAGINYRLTVSIGCTKCTPSQTQSGNDDCVVQKTTQCTFIVYVVTWMNSVSMTSSNCG